MDAHENPEVGFGFRLLFEFGLFDAVVGLPQTEIAGFWESEAIDGKFCLLGLSEDSKLDELFEVLLAVLGFVAVVAGGLYLSGCELLELLGYFCCCLFCFLELLEETTWNSDC